MWIGCPGFIWAAVLVGKEKGCCRTKVCHCPAQALELSNGYREMQLFLLGYIIVSICEIFTVGGIPLNPKVVLVS